VVADVDGVNRPSRPTSPSTARRTAPTSSRVIAKGRTTGAAEGQRRRRRHGRQGQVQEEEVHVEGRRPSLSAARPVLRRVPDDVWVFVNGLEVIDRAATRRRPPPWASGSTRPPPGSPTASSAPSGLHGRPRQGLREIEADPADQHRQPAPATPTAGHFERASCPGAGPARTVLPAPARTHAPWRPRGRRGRPRCRLWPPGYGPPAGLLLPGLYSILEVERLMRRLRVKGGPTPQQTRAGSGTHHEHHDPATDPSQSARLILAGAHRPGTAGRP
jgi:hypothetical protein